MENTGDIAEALRLADRAAAAPYIDYPATVAWYPPAMGVWAAAFCLGIAIPDGNPFRTLVMLVLVAVEVAFLFWYRRLRGTWPRGRAPEEIRKVLLAFLAGAATVIGIVAIAVWLVAAWVAAIVAFAVVTAAVAWYERAYAAAAARVRVRLG